MKNNISLSIILILMLLLTACKKDILVKDKNQTVNLGNEGLINEQIDLTVPDLIQERLDVMTLEEKIGQLLIVGFEGTEINTFTRIMIEEYKIGGFIIFSRNIVDENQLLYLINDLKTLNKENSAPLFISIDEEGGLVSRLPTAYKKLPSSEVLGDINNSDISYKFGKILGKRLNLLGINLNFAPVIDIDSNPKNPIIGKRSFGDSAEVVINNGINVLKGIEAERVISAVKHFPGHGDTSVDSHVNLPIVNKSLKELQEMELLPFKKAIEQKVDMIMVAHILFPELDVIYPSTMSSTILGGLLRKELGFNGVIISDDMTMGAIIENYTLKIAVLEFLRAGGDIALICHGQENPKIVIDFIKESIINKDINIEDINEKVYRILNLKNKYNLHDDFIESINLQEINKSTEELLNEINK